MVQFFLLGAVNGQRVIFGYIGQSNGSRNLQTRSSYHWLSYRFHDKNKQVGKLKVDNNK